MQSVRKVETFSCAFLSAKEVLFFYAIICIHEIWGNCEAFLTASDLAETGQKSSESATTVGTHTD